MVIDLFSRQVIGWSMMSRMDRDLVLNALLMAIWRNPSGPVIVHSDQDSQYSSHDWQAFLQAQPECQHEPTRQLPRQRCCGSFFQLLKRERIKRKIYIDREEARRDVFNYIELFYNPKRRHGYANGLSPVEFEKQYFNRQQVSEAGAIPDAIRRTRAFAVCFAGVALQLPKPSGDLSSCQRWLCDKGLESRAEIIQPCFSFRRFDETVLRDEFPQHN